MHFPHPATSATHSRFCLLLGPCCSRPSVTEERKEISAEPLYWPQVPAIPRPRTLATIPQGLRIALPLVRKGGDVSSRVLERGP